MRAGFDGVLVAATELGRTKIKSPSGSKTCFSGAISNECSGEQNPGKPLLEVTDRGSRKRESVDEAVDENEKSDAAISSFEIRVVSMAMRMTLTHHSATEDS